MARAASRRFSAETISLCSCVAMRLRASLIYFSTIYNHRQKKIKTKSFVQCCFETSWGVTITRSLQKNGSSASESEQKGFGNLTLRLVSHQCFFSVALRQGVVTAIVDRWLCCGRRFLTLDHQNIKHPPSVSSFFFSHPLKKAHNFSSLSSLISYNKVKRNI